MNPIILGEGVPLFGRSVKPVHLELQDAAGYDDGLQIITYKINYE